MCKGRYFLCERRFFMQSRALPKDAVPSLEDLAVSE